MRYKDILKNLFSDKFLDKILFYLIFETSVLEITFFLKRALKIDLNFPEKLKGIVKTSTLSQLIYHRSFKLF